MKPFDVGDKVKCVDSSSPNLIVGDEYTIKQVLKLNGEWYVRVEELNIEHTYWSGRFIITVVSLENE